MDNQGSSRRPRCIQPTGAGLSEPGLQCCLSHAAGGGCRRGCRPGKHDKGIPQPWQLSGGSFKSWIIRIVVNTCYDALRSRKRRRTDSLDDFGDDDYGTDGGSDYSPQLEDPAERPDAYVQRMELSQLIEQGIARLPADQRLALTLCDVHGYAYEEISEITGMPMGTVKSRINRARAKVREYLWQYPELLPASFRP